MPTYAIGDVQGCYDDLQRLLKVIEFDPARDKLWFVGDLVNRGPDSAKVLRFVRDLGDRAVAVLGNHDLHLLGIVGGVATHRHEDAMRDILEAPDRDELLKWLRHLPLAHYDTALGVLMIHAGLPQQWDLAHVVGAAAEVEAVLQGPNYLELLQRMYGDEPVYWDRKHKRWDRLRFTINCLTRLRCCDTDGRLVLKFKESSLDAEGQGLIPWFRMPRRQSRNIDIVFGHWSALGLYRGEGVFGLDSGCVWGGALSALCLESREIFSVACRGQKLPGLD